MYICIYIFLGNAYVTYQQCKPAAGLICKGTTIQPRTRLKNKETDVRQISDKDVVKGAFLASEEK